MVREESSGADQVAVASKESRRGVRVWSPGMSGERRWERALYVSRRQSPPSWMVIVFRLGQWLTRKAAGLVTTSEVMVGNVKMERLVGVGDVSAAMKMSTLRLIMLSSRVAMLGRRLMHVKRARASVEEV